MTDSADHIRAFIAMPLPEDLRAEIERPWQELKAAPGASLVKWTPLHQLHLTLRFLGNVPTDAVPDIHTAIQRACAGTAAFTLRLQGAGAFPSLKNPRVLWLGLSDERETLQRLQAAIESETRSWGEIEDRAFHPHLTLGRVKFAGGKAARTLSETLLQLVVPRGPWPVREVLLMQSRLTPTGAEHRLLLTTPLAGTSVLTN